MKRMNMMTKPFGFFPVKRRSLVLLCTVLLWSLPWPLLAQSARDNVRTKTEQVIDGIIKETADHSQLERLAHELLDVIGPRLVGTPQMDLAHDWAVKTYESWGIPARNEQFGEWRGWERGISHIDMVYPRSRTLAGTQLAWSPSTDGKRVEGEVITLPDLEDPSAFKTWLPNVKGKH